MLRPSTVTQNEIEVLKKQDPMAAFRKIHLLRHTPMASSNPGSTSLSIGELDTEVIHALHQLRSYLFESEFLVVVEEEAFMEAGIFKFLTLFPNILFLIIWLNTLSTSWLSSINLQKISHSAGTLTSNLKPKKMR